jgi:hypothetical protein
MNWLGSTIGALHRRSVYRMRVSPELEALMPVPKFVLDQLDAWKVQHLRSQNFDLPELTPPAMEAIAMSLPPDQRAFLRLMYVSAQRMTSILNLRSRDAFTIFPAPPKWQLSHVCLSLRFREGKTIKSTGPYTIHVLFPVMDYQVLLLHEEFIFGQFRRQTAKAVSAALRRAGHDVRQCRRGSLRFLARNGATVEQLLLLSRHTSPRMLYQYLGAGLHLEHEMMTMVQMSENLI